MPVSKGYSRAQIILHWVVAVLVVPQFLLSGQIAHAFEAWMTQQPVPFNPAVALHVLTGMTIMALVIWRLVLRVRHGAPPPIDAGSPAMTKLATSVQHTMYLVLILLAISGSTAWFAGFGVAASVHSALRLLLILLILIHVAGALKGHFVQKSGIMTRMMKAED